MDLEAVGLGVGRCTALQSGVTSFRLFSQEAALVRSPRSSGM